LYESAWEVLKDILLGHKANNTAILKIADKRLREGLTNKDKNLVCTLVFLEPTILSRETALLERMISYIGHEKFRDCVTSALLTRIRRMTCRFCARVGQFSHSIQQLIES
jgi:hypothetical protein